MQVKFDIDTEIYYKYIRWITSQGKTVKDDLGEYIVKKLKTIKEKKEPKFKGFDL